MKLTKLEHSGIVLEKNGKKLVFDPVEFAGTLPVHDGLLSEMGKTIYDNLLRATCEEIGAEFALLGVGESIEI